MITINMAKQARFYSFPNWQQLSLKILWTITHKWVNTNLPAFQNESVKEIMSVWVKNDRTILKEIAKVDQWNFLIYLYNNYFRSFLTVLRDLTGNLISNLMNNKRTYFNFKMKFTQSPGNEYLLEYSIWS